MGLILWLQNRIRKNIRDWKYRHNILNQISEDNLKLTDKQVFYTESDTSYYGLPDETKILPFQSGFGQTLLVWFEKSERFPNDFFVITIYGQLIVKVIKKLIIEDLDILETLICLNQK